MREERKTNALFMVILIAYAEPKTLWCHIEVRIESIIVVGPKQYANAYTANEATVPLTVVAQFTRAIEQKTPAPQKATYSVSGDHVCEVLASRRGSLRMEILFPQRSMNIPRSGTTKKPPY